MFTQTSTFCRGSQATTTKFSSHQCTSVSTSQLRRTARARAVCTVCQAVSSPRESLIPSTLEDMAADTELTWHLAEVQREGQAALTRREQLTRQRALDSRNLPSFHKTCKDQGVSPLVRAPAKTLQLNIGLYCNQACTHCHVESSPKRTEMMDRRTAEACLQLLRSNSSITTVDITGGAPELNQQFRFLVTEARALGLQVLDRCNLTVLLEPGQEDLGAFLAQQRVQVVASLPCYGQKNVDQQRGAGVFQRSIEALQMLNALGYGSPGSGLQLDLVYNPGGDSLAPSQERLEAAYKQELRDLWGVEFNRLYCLNNMPIKRFADYLQRRGKVEEYMQLLVGAFNPAAAEGVMCRDTVSVGWDGRLYDCDFNQQLEMVMPRPSSSGGSGSAEGAGAGAGRRPGLTVFDLNSLSELEGRQILVDSHCFGCTAGAGSSCTGAVA